MVKVFWSVYIEAYSINVSLEENLINLYAGTVLQSMVLLSPSGLKSPAGAHFYLFRLARLKRQQRGLALSHPYL